MRPNFEGSVIQQWLAQDLANQVAFGESYRAEVQKRGISVGRFLSVSTAEWFQGQTAN